MDFYIRREIGYVSLVVSVDPRLTVMLTLVANKKLSAVVTLALQ